MMTRHRLRLVLLSAPCLGRLLAQIAIAIIASLLLALPNRTASACQTREQPPSSRPPIDFLTDIAPLLKRSCLPCHAGPLAKSGYRLDSSTTAFRGGDFAVPAIVPGMPKESHLWKVISPSSDRELPMPPLDSPQIPFSNEECELIYRWIEQGAPWPDQQILQAPSQVQHWSFQSLQSQVPPGLPSHAPPSAIIDAFLDAALQQHNLQTTPLADRRTLIRRLTFDLIGLPPTPEEIDAFLNDPASDNVAWEKLVNRLLESPHYGERWARHWLDVARYTESQGFEYDRLRPNAWHYRDYVIESFQNDKPYDQFMKEQIAGDVIQPQSREGRIATSFLVCGPWDQAGNGQSNPIQRATTREEELEDLVAVVGQSMLGLTIQCARCHSHKYDPISQQEYFQVKAVFEGVKHGEDTLRTPDESKRIQTQLAELQMEDARLRDTVSQLETKAKTQLSLRSNPQALSHPAPIPTLRFSFHDPDQRPQGELRGDANLDADGLQLPTEGSYFQSEPLGQDIASKTLEAWVRLPDLDQRGGGVISLESRNGLTFDAIVFGERQAHHWLAGSDGFRRTRDSHGPAETEAHLNWTQIAITYSHDGTIQLYRNGLPYGLPYVSDPPAPQRFPAQESHLVFGMRHLGGNSPWLLGTIRQAALYDYALSSEEIAASFEAHRQGPTRAELLASLDPSDRQKWLDAEHQRDRIVQQSAALQAPDLSYIGTRFQPPPTHLLARGDVRQPQQQVRPMGLSAIAQLSADLQLTEESPEGLRRLRFADWIASPENPLPPRVLVNRIWHHHFGRGMVPTPNDLGASGEPPSHPQLLDWLAHTFVTEGWSIKKLHRWIVSTHAYRRSSQALSESLSKDAENQFLWRYSPRRMEAEVVRDSLLAISRVLNRQRGGPSFRPFRTTEFNATFYHPEDSHRPDWQRRSIYRINVQSGKDPLLDVLDCPDPSVKTPRRNVTTTPLQALELMNSPLVLRTAQQLAARLEQQATHDLDAQIDQAFLLTLGRLPIPSEKDQALSAVRERGLASLAWTLFNLTEFLYVQ